MRAQRPPKHAWYPARCAGGRRNGVRFSSWMIYYKPTAGHGLRLQLGMSRWPRRPKT
jgi:hypothetical protein